MLRLLISGLLLSTARRPAATAYQHSIAPLSRTLTASATCRNNHNYIMEQPFEKMAEEGVPKCDKPSEVSAPKKEDQDLPKMSPQEFRVYNRMAEHMDMFVRPPPSPSPPPASQPQRRDSLTSYV